jgi:hypothetical protein
VHTSGAGELKELTDDSSQLLCYSIYGIAEGGFLLVADSGHSAGSVAMQQALLWRCRMDGVGGCQYMQPLAPHVEEVLKVALCAPVVQVRIGREFPALLLVRL